MRRPIVIAYLVVLALLFPIFSEAESPSATLPEGARVSEKVFGLRGLDNVGRVAPGIFRGAQPGAEGYATLKEMGIKSVVNLRTRHPETEAVESAGMKSIEIPIGMLSGVNEEIIRKAVDAISNPENQPVYVHCALGEDRTGVVVAVYRMEVEGWSMDDAVAEMQDFGFNDVWIHLRRFINSYKDGK